MSQHTVNRRQAGRFTLIARAAVGVLVLGALSIAVFGLPETPSAARGGLLPPMDNGVQTPDSRGSGLDGMVDAKGIAIRLSQIGNAPKHVQAQASEDEPPPDYGDQTDYTSYEVDEIKFLGVIREPGRMLALTRIAGRQTVMWTGRVVSGVKLLEVDPAWIRIESDGVESRIDRAERTTVALTKITSPAPAAPMRGAPDAALRFNEAAGEDRSRAEVQRLLQDARSRARTIRAGPGVQGTRVTDPNGGAQ